MSGPTPDFWQDRFITGQTGWDRGGPGPQLLAWLQGGELQPCRIAVPGCGRGWDVLELAHRGFDVTGIDYTTAAVQQTRARLDEAGASVQARARVVQADVLAYSPPHAFDAVYEQTCLCAIHPEHWMTYARRLQDWLRPQGQLFALFMQVPREAATEQGVIQGPPYHCDINAMRALFPESAWEWPQPPYTKVPHPNLTPGHELAVRLLRR